MERNMRKQGSVYWFATGCLLFVCLIASSGCGLNTPPLEVTTLTLPRSEVRDVIRDDEVRFEIDDHNLQLTADEIERLNDAISAEFMRTIENTMGRKIHDYDAIQVGEYGLGVTLRVEPMAGVVPLNP
jgi:hypothetical protein